jgi:hypothetical protein
MDLTLTICSSNLCVTVLNTSSQELRLWELENSWGWFSFSLYLRGEMDEEVRIIKRMSRDWTKNGPYFYVLSPAESRNIQLNINDGWWDKPASLSKLYNASIYVRTTLNIDPSPEADEFDIFVGTVQSNEILSVSPHLWLYASEGDESL